jgi:hypothetical protein
VVLGGGAAALTLTPPGRRLLERSGLAVPPDTGAGAATPAPRNTSAALAQVPPVTTDTLRADTIRPDTTSTTPPRRPDAPTRPPATRPVVSTPAPPAAEVGYLTINADPYGRVYVDGRPAGDTPVSTYQVPAGRHVIEIRKEGYVPVVDTVVVLPGETVRIHRVLTARQP